MWKACFFRKKNTIAYSIRADGQTVAVYVTLLGSALATTSFHRYAAPSTTDAEAGCFLSCRACQDKDTHWPVTRRHSRIILQRSIRCLPCYNFLRSLRIKLRRRIEPRCCSLEMRCKEDVRGLVITSLILLVTPRCLALSDVLSYASLSSRMELIDSHGKSVSNY